MEKETKTRNKTKTGDFNLGVDYGSLSRREEKKRTDTKIKLDVRKDKPRFDFGDLTSVTAHKVEKGLSDIEKKLKTAGVEPESDIDISDKDEIDHLKKLAGVDKKVGHETLPAKIENLPKILNKELEKHGSTVYPEWTPINKLPGYMKGAIRAFGRKIFQVLAPGVPLEDFLVISTVGRLNTERELNAVANYLKNHGMRDTEKSGKIIELLPDYDPMVAVYRASGYVWLVVQDFMGKYIYAAEDRGRKIEYRG